MKEYFIYQYEDSISFSHRQMVTVVFIHQRKIESKNTLTEEINSFFQQHNLSDKLVVILPEYLEQESLKYFTKTPEETFKRIPGGGEEYFQENLLIYQFCKDGNLTQITGKKFKNESNFKSHLYRSGTTFIFKKNGGLVESSPDHHFVFPSHKHCSKFIRTGNVLINNSEIFFISVQLLKHVQNKKVIYCDTSSINVLPYTTFELMRRFEISFKCPPVHSFKAYEVFESEPNKFHPEGLILISSSTSGNIIDRLLKERRAERSQIQVIYFLGPPENFNNHSGNIICNLTKDDKFSIGINEFKTYPGRVDCKLCENYSRPINIRSDVFLTIQPKVEPILISTIEEIVPKGLSTFVEKYRSKGRKNVVIKNFNKETSKGDIDYEIFLDANLVYDSILNNKNEYSSFDDNLSRLIDKFIPANLKYIIFLPDEGSDTLVKLIEAKIPNKIKPKKIKLEQGFDNQIQGRGSAVIVASCITTGEDLLHISRLMRKHENISLTYFIGFLRTPSRDYSKRLINNLSKGKNASDERPFVAVEKTFCSNKQKNTSWHEEKKFLEEVLGDLHEEDDADLYNFIDCRLETLKNNRKNKGLSSQVFLPKHDQSELKLNKNFAFWNFDYEEDEVSQSEVYFTISLIISNLKNKKINSKFSLQQSNYVRNILSPGNFQRFNDGIIQAAILRAGSSEHFAYDLDKELSLEMKTLLRSMIEQYNTEHGEALLEFILAIGVKKLSLKNEDRKEVLDIASECENEIISTFAKRINTILM